LSLNGGGGVGLGWGEAAAAAHAGPEAFALFGGHGGEAGFHLVAPVAAAATVAAVAVEASEEDLAEEDKGNGLEEGDGAQAKDSRHEPVPDVLDDEAEDEDAENDEEGDVENLERAWEIVEAHGCGSLSGLSGGDGLLEFGKAFAEVEHGVAFAREQGVDGGAGFGGDFFEAAAEEFVGDEGFALLFGELVEGFVEGVEEEGAGVEGVGAGVG